MSRKAGRRRQGRPRFRITIDPAQARHALRWALVALGVALALLVGVPLARDVATTHPYFAVREVAVRHHGQLDEGVLRALAGITPGMNIWDVDVDATTTRMLTYGWVRSATVRRELPNRIVLQVREHRPVAVLAVADESPGLYYLAANGRIFAAVGANDVRDLPYVTGLGRRDLTGGEAFGPRAVRRALGLLRHAQRYPQVGVVSEVHVDRAHGLTLMPTRPALPIEIGWGEYDEKLARLAEVLPRWAGRESELRGVSCLYDDEVILRTRAARGPKAGRKTSTGTTTKSGTKAVRVATGA
ncbi:MAG: cell division protein FtsQ/DivIB [Candidatus Binatia bacterium]